jgi:hypothetical protein
MQLGSSPRKGNAIAFVAILVVCLSVPALAQAAITVPPGATEGDQYFEETPNGGGSGSVNRGGDGSGGGPPVAASGELNALGPEGQAAAELANLNRPPQQGKANQANQGSRPEPASSSTEGEGGMGFFFPLLLVVTALAAGAYGLRRRLTPT